MNALISGPQTYYHDNLFCIQIKNISSIQIRSQEGVTVTYLHTYNCMPAFCFTTDLPLK